MKRHSIAFIIHLFAILHAAVALSCRFAAIDDELFLTILTMTMVLLLCMKKKLNVEFSAASIIIANVIGYLLGNIGAVLLDKVINSPYAINALSTAFTTEVLGWSIVAVTTILRPNRRQELTDPSESYLKWILGAIAGVFILRICMILLFSNGSFGTMDMVNAMTKVFSNSFALITIFCVNIIYIRYSDRLTRNMKKPMKAVLLLVFMLTVSILETLLVSELSSTGTDVFRRAFPSLFIISLLAQMTVYSLVFMANYSLTARLKMQKEMGKANMAQYRYMKLKQQVNPHFLFNSLNILDCLVCEEKSEEASIYIHKLAGIYRYMIQSEEEVVVPLRDELGFVNQYIDLLCIRFPAGLEVKINLPEESMRRYVLPCAVQLLIENATKHNTINAENPLTITVGIREDRMFVSNNIVPKVGRVESTGLGLKYLRQQYLDICGKSIAIEHTDKIFCVTLPLI